MTTPQQDKVTVLPTQLERAAKLAMAMTADPEVTTHSDGEWTMQDVINVAVGRGLDEMERTYLK